MTSTGPRYDDMSALFINCTLKRSPELSHTQGLIDAQRRDHAPSTASTSRRSGPSTTTSPPASGRT